MISGYTAIIPHIGYPTESFKAPLIYNPWFAARGIDAVVIPMGCKAETFPTLLPSVFALSNIRGALITMPHKMTVLGMLDEISTVARVAGACNAVTRLPDGRLAGDMFDGEGFVRGLLRKGCEIRGRRALIVGSGGVGSAIAASLAAAGAGALTLYDLNRTASEALAGRLEAHFPALRITIGDNDPAGHDIVVNGSPLGMKPDDPLPLDVSRIAPESFAGEVVMKQEKTPFIVAAEARGCRIQPGIDMLFEMIPAYLEFFGFPSATAEELRALATIRY